jgi:hypothetical protein
MRLTREDIISCFSSLGCHNFWGRCKTRRLFSCFSKRGGRNSNRRSVALMSGSEDVVKRWGWISFMLRKKSRRLEIGVVTNRRSVSLVSGATKCLFELRVRFYTSSIFLLNIKLIQPPLFATFFFADITAHMDHCLQKILDPPPDSAISSGVIALLCLWI